MIDAENLTHAQSSEGGLLFAGPVQKAIRALPLATLLALACGGAENQGATAASGTFSTRSADVTFTAKDGAATLVTTVDGGLSNFRLGVILTDFGGACGVEPSFKAGSQTLRLDWNQTSDITPGTYPLTIDLTTLNGSGTGVSALFAEYDAQCAEHIGEFATSGSISIDAISSARISGSVNLVFPDGTVAGSFDAAMCEINWCTIVASRDFLPVCNYAPGVPCAH